MDWGDEMIIAELKSLIHSLPDDMVIRTVIGEITGIYIVIGDGVQGDSEPVAVIWEVE